MNFQFSTTLLLGAFLQTLLVLFIPRAYALTPAALILLVRLLDTLSISYGMRKNPYLEGVIPKKTSAVVPDQDGEFSNGPANEKIAVLLLGAKSNHPLNIFAPGFSEMSDYLMKMTDELEKEAPHNGFLGQSNWMNKDKNGCAQFNAISYWRSIDDIHAFAHGPLHREAWQWWEKGIKQGKNAHLGINHEIYSADKGQWENIYVNFQPTGLGATTFLRRGDKLEGGVVSDSWISPLFDASKGKLRTSAGRLGWAPAIQHDKYGPNVYE